MISYNYSIPYILIFIVLIISAYIENKVRASQRKYIQNLSTIIFILFIGFRGYVGWDWYYYHELYNRIAFNNSSFELKPNEKLYPGFIVILQILKIFTHKFLVVSTTITIINSLFFFSFFKKHALNISLGFALIIAFCLNIQIDLLRNSLAISIFLYSTTYIQRKKPLPYIVLNLIGATIHLSSIVFIPLYFLINKNWNNWVIKAVLCVSTIIYFIQYDYSQHLVNLLSIVNPDLSTKFEIYSSIESYLQSEISLPVFFLKLIMVIVTFKYYNSIVRYNNFYKLFINLIIVHFLSYTLFAGFSIIQDRLSLLFIISYVVVIHSFIKFIPKKEIFILGFILIQIVSIGIRYKSIMFNYHNYIFQENRFNQAISTWENNAYILNPLENKSKW